MSYERIPTIDFCAVPKSYAQVNDFIASLPPEERANAVMVQMMTHNFLASRHNQMMENNDD